jgi:hypothetical protein
MRTWSNALLPEHHALEAPENSRPMPKSASRFRRFVAEPYALAKGRAAADA